MSTYYYGPALDSELDYRRHELQHDADADRLAREFRRSTVRVPHRLTRRHAATRTATRAA